MNEKSINVAEAKKHFSDLLSQVAAASDDGKVVPFFFLVRALYLLRAANGANNFSPVLGGDNDFLPSPGEMAASTFVVEQTHRAPAGDDLHLVARDPPVATVLAADLHTRVATNDAER